MLISVVEGGDEHMYGAASWWYLFHLMFHVTLLQDTYAVSWPGLAKVGSVHLHAAFQGYHAEHRLPDAPHCTENLS